MMRLLIDTHLLIWAASSPEKLSSHAQALLLDVQNELFFSPVSIWEIVIKAELHKENFMINPSTLYRGLLRAGYQELLVRTEHTLNVATLPTIHKDPFDRLLLAQASVEKMQLLTADGLLAQYPDWVLCV